MTRLALLAAVALLLGAGAATAETRVTNADLAEIRAVIHRQIGAFRACARRPVPRGAASASSVSFLEATLIGVEDVVQRVQVTDRAGAVWLAYYVMQRRSDGRWRTSGCTLVEPNKTISAAYRPR